MMSHFFIQLKHCASYVVILIVETTYNIGEDSPLVVFLIWQFDHQVSHGFVKEFSHNGGAICHKHGEIIQFSCVLIKILNWDAIWVTEPNHMLHDISIEFPKSAVKHLMESFKASDPNLCMFISVSCEETARQVLRKM